MTQDPTLYIKLLNRHAQAPTKASPGSAGWDIYCTASVDIPPGRRAILDTGLAMKVDTGWYGRIAPRSGLAAKQGYNVHAGVVDSDYRGEVKVALINHGDNTLEFRKGDRIAQLIVERCSSGDLVVVDELDATERGAGGLGSSGR